MEPIPAPLPKLNIAKVLAVLLPLSVCNAPRQHTTISRNSLILKITLTGLVALFASFAFALNDDPPAVKVGKYQVELRMPPDGLYAGTVTDVEFRLSDTTKNDPIEGKKGVVGANPTATVTMPSMAGMPVVRPRIHSEGVPGDYGLELFFGHGGDYKVGIRLSPPGDKPIYASFLVHVKDEDSPKTSVKPFLLSLLDLPKDPKAGVPIPLNLIVRDSMTGVRVKSFDVSHTKLLHLMLVSKDLNWFVHEHPVPHPDGTFTMDWTFPYGGDYLVFADVAPKNKGLQVISTRLRVHGKTAPAAPKLMPTNGPSRDGSIVAQLVKTPITVGSSLDLTFRLRDARTGKPVTDLQPYLGALGHLMIIHQDGETFVHSHPAEGAAAVARAKRGEVQFSARFPRPGLYKAWVQFQRGGKVATLSFVIDAQAAPVAGH